ncbi:MAG: ROK family protein [Verrucomicrobiaceae bacterium]|nr:ROK family protein [Verrucomicrobiaceae bacterium]
MAGKRKPKAATKPAPKAVVKVKKKLKQAPAAVPKLKSVPFWIGFDLGGTKMLACVLDKDYNVLGTARKSTNGSDGQAKGRKKIVNCVHEAIVSAGVDPKGIQGIGIGCPGLVNPERGVLLVAPNLGWHNMGLSALLTKEFCVPVSVLNDVDAGTFGEYKLGAAMGARSVLGVFPGTGVGAGFVYNGQLVMGRTISCMELGNIMLPGTHLGSSEFGTVILEDLTSRLAVAAQAGVGCYRGQAPELNRRTAGNLRDIRSKAIATSMKSADEAMVTVIRNSIRYLGMGVAMVVNLFAPDQIVLGGGLVEELPTVYLTMLKEEVARYAMPELVKGLKFSIAKLSGTAVAVGSVAWLRNGEAA